MSAAPSSAHAQLSTNTHGGSIDDVDISCTHNTLKASSMQMQACRTRDRKHHACAYTGYTGCKPQMGASKAAYNGLSYWDICKAATHVM